MYWAVKTSLSKIKKAKDKNIIEVGSGLGYLTYSLFKEGYNIKGLELSPSAVNRAKDKYGESLFICGDVCEYATGNSHSFDIIIMTEVIEHVENVPIIFSSLCDLLKSGGSLIITTPNNGSSNIRIFNYDATEEMFMLFDWFWAYAEDFRGGVDVAISNIDGDEYNEIVTVPQSGGGPNLRVYEYDADTSELRLLDWVMAYDASFRGTMNVKVADLEGDGDSEIITSPLTLGGPNVRIFDYSDEDFGASQWFMAYGEAFRGGVTVTTGK